MAVIHRRDDAQKGEKQFKKLDRCVIDYKLHPAFVRLIGVFFFGRKAKKKNTTTKSWAAR